VSTSNNIGPYELIEELGRGAMARVWRAYDPKLEREVAIKEPVFEQSLSDQVLSDMAEYFVNEGLAVAKLNHPGIVTIYASDVYDKRPAIVMELINGVTLGDMLKSGPIDPITTMQIIDQLLDAVGYAHLQGVVHRDIKPDNIFITLDGQVKLGDFGVAHVEDTELSKSQFGIILGTPGYMAPEQARGDVVDNRTDLFAIGAIAYEMLYGLNPFSMGEINDFSAIIYRTLNEQPAELPAFVNQSLAFDVRPAIYAALSKDPSYRPQSAAAFKAMLCEVPVTAPDAAYDFAANISEDVLSDNASDTTSDALSADSFYASLSTNDLVDDSTVAPTKKRSSNSLLAILIVIGVVVLLVLFVSASSGSGGGGGGSFFSYSSGSSSTSGSISASGTGTSGDSSSSTSTGTSSGGGNSSTSGAMAPSASKLVGKWKENRLNNEIVPIDIIFEFRSNGTGKETVDSNSLEFKWSLTGDVLTLTSEDFGDETCTIEFAGDTLIIITGEFNLEFKKL
jgi:serine/threonine-protein kinase